MMRAGSAVSDSSTAPSTDCSASRFWGGGIGPSGMRGRAWPLVVRSVALIRGRSSLGCGPAPDPGVPARCGELLRSCRGSVAGRRDVTIRGMPIDGLDHVQVAAPPGCESEARRFYGGLLGLAELTKPEGLAGRGGAWFQCGRQQLHVGVTDDFEPARKAHPALRVSGVVELERLAEWLTHAGVDVHWEDALAGVRRFYVEDPWGNRLELLTAA